MTGQGEFFRQDLDTKPLYNIKAVVESTGLPAATLRAWERRYGALAPTRTESGYRLYSERDIALLKWLKARTDEGVSISHALEMLAHYEKERPVRLVVEERADRGQGIHAARQAALAALLQFDESRTDEVLEEAFAAYGLEPVSEQVIVPIMAQIGERWHRGRVTTAAEHFASNYLRRKLEAIINAAPRNERGPLVVLGCAPGDWHELGLLLIYMFMRRRGYNVIYLGQNVPVEQFVDEMRRLRPALVLISASTEESVKGVVQLGQAVTDMDLPRPIFGFGGAVFNAQASLRAGVPGTFLGDNAREAVTRVGELLSKGQAPARTAA